MILGLTKIITKEPPIHALLLVATTLFMNEHDIHKFCLYLLI